MSEFFHNLSTQALSKSDNSGLLKFDVVNKFNKSINSLLVNEMLAYENAEIEKLQNFLVGDEPTINNKTESAILQETLKDEKRPSDADNDDSHIPILKRAGEIEQKNIIQNSLFLETKLKKVERDFETVNTLGEEGTGEVIQIITNPDYEHIFNNMINVDDWVYKIMENQEVREPRLDRHTPQFLCSSRCVDLKKQWKFSPSNACKQ